MTYYVQRPYLDLSITYMIVVVDYLFPWYIQTCQQIVNLMSLLTTTSIK